MTKSICFFFPLRANFEITRSQSIHYTRYVDCWEENLKMGVHATKSGVKVTFLLTVVTKVRFSWDISITIYGNFPFLSCSNKKDMFRSQILKKSRNLERCSADSNRAKMKSTYLLSKTGFNSFGQRLSHLGSSHYKETFAMVGARSHSMAMASFCL